MWTLVAALALVGFVVGAVFAAGSPEPTEADAPLPTVNVWWRLLLAVVALLYVNQVLFNVYVAVERGGDTGFIGLDGGSAYFHLAPDHAPVRWLVDHIASADVLEITVLRVQAVLELPFALSAFLAIAWLLDRQAAQRIAGGPLGLLAALHWTGVLCVMELLLENPYTQDDLVLRGVGVLVTAPLLYALGRRPLPAELPSYPRLVLFFVGLGALSVLVVGTNAIALLYNLGWLGRFAPFLAVCALVAGVAVFASGRVAPAAPTPYLRLLHAVGRRFTLLFCVPALPIRYGLSRAGSREGAAMALAGVCLVAVLGGFHEASWRLSPAAQRRLGLQLGVGLGVGVLLAATHVFGLLNHPAMDAPDVNIAVKGGLVLGSALLMVLVDRVAPPEP